MKTSPLETTTPNALEAGGYRNPSLARKYACPGPRYTSYPTAPHFNDETACKRYLRDTSSDNQFSTDPLSLYVHLPFCADICYYCACNKVVTRNREAAREYLYYLEKEIELQSQLVGDKRPITQLHWGGGTPTFLEDAELTRLMHILAKHFRLLSEDHREYSIEVDPRTVGSDTLALLKGIGFNRISMGVQDFDRQVQASVNRLQHYDMVKKLTGNVRSLRFKSLGFDLIYGLPHQTIVSVTETLRKVVALSPDRIACYSYAHLPKRFSSQRAIDRLALPTADTKLRLHELICDTLQRNGYIHIGMDHFVKPDDELALAQTEGRLQRNFQGYSRQLAFDTLGIGASAISHMGDDYLQNATALDEYYSALRAGDFPIKRGYRMSVADKQRRHIIMSLACHLKLDIREFEDQFRVNFDEQFSPQIAAMTDMVVDGLVELRDGLLLITQKGRPFIRNICMVFDAYLDAPQTTSDSVIYSATI